MVELLRMTAVGSFPVDAEASADAMVIVPPEPSARLPTIPFVARKLDSPMFTLVVLGELVLRLDTVIVPPGASPESVDAVLSPPLAFRFAK